MAPWLCFNSTVELQCVIITAISTGHKHSITFVHLHVIFQHQKMPVTVDTLTPTCYCLHPHVASENLTRHLGWKQQNHIVAYETTRTKQIQYTGTLTLKKKKKYIVLLVSYYRSLSHYASVTMAAIPNCFLHSELLKSIKGVMFVYYNTQVRSFSFSTSSEENPKLPQTQFESISEMANSFSH